MATFNKLDQFPKDMLNAIHDFDTHSFKVALGNVTPTVSTATYAAFSALGGEVANGNGYTTTGKVSATWAIVTGSSANIGKVTGVNVVWTATGNWAATSIRYAYTYNDTPTSPADPGLCWHDYGSAISLLNTETFTWDTASSANGILTLT